MSNKAKVLACLSTRKISMKKIMDRTGLTEKQVISTLNALIHADDVPISAEKRVVKFFKLDSEVW